MKKIRLVLLALGVSALLSFCVSTGSLERAGAHVAALGSPATDLPGN